MPNDKHFDFIIAGGGAAGLSLALHIARSPLRHSSILVVDKHPKDRDDRTWGFWERAPSIYEPIVYRSWERLKVVGQDFTQSIDLGDYRYKMLRGLDFYRFARAELGACPNVSFKQGVVRAIADGAEGAQVTIDERIYHGKWVFDSRLRVRDLAPQSADARYHSLKLHFRGWEIETAQPAFDPGALTFLDFRTPQNGAARFFYLLPFSPERALVEYTCFSAGALKRADYERALEDYIEGCLGVQGYHIQRVESGCLPVTDRPFPRQLGERVMAIGAKGGRIKPTTGYAFSRIQEDSAAIVSSLLRHRHPFDIPGDSPRYRLYDSLFLHIMAHHGEHVQPIFKAMFARNPIERVFRFLDERASLWENLALIATLPPSLFLQALFRRLAQPHSAWPPAHPWQAAPQPSYRDESQR